MRVTDLLVHSSFDFSTLYTTQGVAFFAKTHFTLDLTTKSVHRINRHLSGFLFAKGKMQDLRRQEEKKAEVYWRRENLWPFITPTETRFCCFSTCPTSTSRALFSSRMFLHENSSENMSHFFTVFENTEKCLNIIFIFLILTRKCSLNKTIKQNFV